MQVSFPERPSQQKRPTLVRPQSSLSARLFSRLSLTRKPEDDEQQLHHHAEEEGGGRGGREEDLDDNDDDDDDDDNDVEALSRPRREQRESLAPAEVARFEAKIARRMDKAKSGRDRRRRTSAIREHMLTSDAPPTMHRRRQSVVRQAQEQAVKCTLPCWDEKDDGIPPFCRHPLCPLDHRNKYLNLGSSDGGHAVRFYAIFTPNPPELDVIS